MQITGMEMIGKNIIIIFLAMILAPLVSYDALAQHGHEPPPATVGDRKLTVSLNVEPVAGETTEYSGRLRLINDDTKETIQHVTYFVTIKSAGTVLLREWFHDHEGDLPFTIRPKDTSQPKVYGVKEPVLNAYMKSGENPVVIEGPIFMTSGTYDFLIEIFSIDNDKTLLNQPIKYEIQVPVGEEAGMQLHGSQTVVGLHVELLTDRTEFEPGIPAKLWLRISDAVTGAPLEKVPHELVIMSDGKEVLRESHDSPSYMHEYTFTEEQKGSVTVSIENLNNTGENLEFGVTVVPEFPLGAILAMTGLVTVMVLVTRVKKIRTVMS
jgi:hypothetical protein